MGLCGARGAGAERVAGFMANTNTFHVLRDASRLQSFCLGVRAGPTRETPVARDLRFISAAMRMIVWIARSLKNRPSPPSTSTLPESPPMASKIDWVKFSR